MVSGRSWRGNATICHGSNDLATGTAQLVGWTQMGTPPQLHAWVVALAAVVIHLSDLQTMAADSDAVVHAVATDRVVERDARGRIVTWTELSVIELRAPSPSKLSGETVWLAQLGGHLDGRSLVVPGAAQVEVGDEVVLFAVAMPGWPTVVIPHTHGAGLFRVIAGLAEQVGHITDAQGRQPEARIIDDLPTFWSQTGLPPR